MDIMLGEIKVDDLMSLPGMENISIITSGAPVTRPSEFLNSSRFPGFIKEMGDNYDLIIFDSPPVLPVSDAVILGSVVDGILVVYEAGKTSRNALKRTTLMLEKVGGKIRGIILNHLKPEVNPDFFSSAMHKYYKEKRSAESEKQNILAKILRLAGRTKSAKK